MFQALLVLCIRPSIYNFLCFNYFSNIQHKKTPRRILHISWAVSAIGVTPILSESAHPSNMEFCCLMGSVGGWVFVLDVTWGEA